jgi:ubiquinone/menaquinone biosynthesis C-methylase UbiE
MPSNAWDTRPASFKKLWNYSIGFYGVWIAHIGTKLGLFKEIASLPVSRRSLAVRKQFYFPAVDVWCSAANALGFLYEKDGRLYLRKEIRPILVDQTSPLYLGGQFSYLALRSLGYAGFDELFTEGKTENMTPTTVQAIAAATEWDHFSFLDAIRADSKLHSRLKKGCMFLDVGCGAGSLMSKLHKIYPRSRFVGVEPSEVAFLHSAKSMQNESITILKMDGESMKFANEFEVVYLGESLYAAKDRAQVLRNCYRALRAGGSIAIVEGLLPEYNNSPRPDTTGKSNKRGRKEKHEGEEENKLILTMQIDFALQGHRFLTAHEVTRLLKDAGFSDITFNDLGGRVFLVFADK